MTDRVVADSSALVALLVDSGRDGTWAAGTLTGSDLLAPHLVMFEAANVFRRHERAGLISADQAVQAHADLVDLSIELWPYELVAARAWELKGSLSIYDAAYVALAELTGTSLITLDRRITGVGGIRCAVSTP